MSHVVKQFYCCVGNNIPCYCSEFVKSVRDCPQIAARRWISLKTNKLIPLLSSKGGLSESMSSKPTVNHIKSRKEKNKQVEVVKNRSLEGDQNECFMKRPALPQAPSPDPSLSSLKYLDSLEVPWSRSIFSLLLLPH